MLQHLANNEISHVIQLAVAPVFLLAGIGSMLGVMSGRLARVVDRARALELKLQEAKAAEFADLHERLRTLDQRARLISRSIALCTLTALLICAVIVTLFTGALMEFNAGLPAALMFIVALLAFALGLLLFLREIFLAAASLRIGASPAPKT
jgi:F0F1-type ATP synthase assembly protein I